MEKTAAEYFNEYAEVEKQSKEDAAKLLEAEQEILFIQKEILKLQLRKKDLEITRGPLSFKVRMQDKDMRLLKNAGYSARNAGL